MFSLRLVLPYLLLLACLLGAWRFRKVMSRVKVCVLGALSTLAVLAVCGVGASPALAEFKLTVKPCNKGGKEIGMCSSSVEKGTELFELEGEEEFVMKQEGTMATKGTIAKKAVEIDCGGTTDVEALAKDEHPETEEDSTDETFLYTGCSLGSGTSEEIKKACKVATEKETDALTSSPNATNDDEDTTKPVSGSTLIEFSLEGSECPETVKGAYPVKGKTICDWASKEELLEALAEHKLACHGDTGLELAKEQAAYEVTYSVKPKNETTGFWAISNEA
jgi:hypothetical protein